MPPIIGWMSYSPISSPDGRAADQNLPKGSPPSSKLGTKPCTRELAGLSAPGTADAKDRLRRLVADKRKGKAELRHVLRSFAAKWDIGQKDITYAIAGHADDTLSDLAARTKR